MKPMKAIPEGYHLVYEIDLAKNPALMIKLNVIGLVMFLVFGWLFAWIMRWVRPEFGGWSGIWSGTLTVNLWSILGIILAYILVLTLHEVVHGVFFWGITGEQPYYGLKAAYAFAAAPGWYIPRNPYLVVGLAPLVVITLLGLLILSFLPGTLLLPWLFAMTANASGAIGDIYVVGWLLMRPSSNLVNDHGDGMKVFGLIE
jgi:hypothetical protein